MKNKIFSFKIDLPPETPKILLNINIPKYREGSKSKFAVPNYINPELAYLAGAVRDGAISKSVTSIGTKYYIAFCNSSYSWLQNTVKPIIEKLFQIKVQDPVIDRKITKYQIRVRKHGIVNFLADIFEHPFGKQTIWKTPSWILAAPTEIKSWYIRGFFDSEGGCGNVIKQKSKYPWQSVFYIGFYGSSSENKCQILDDIRSMLENDLNIISNPIKRDFWKRRNSYRTVENCFFFRISSPKEKMKFIQKIGSSHPEKLNNLLELAKMIAVQS